jgi:hypothetical protein
MATENGTETGEKKVRGQTRQEQAEAATTLRGPQSTISKEATRWLEQQ